MDGMDNSIIVLLMSVEICGKKWCGFGEVLASSEMTIRHLYREARPGV